MKTLKYHFKRATSLYGIYIVISVLVYVLLYFSFGRDLRAYDVYPMDLSMWTSYLLMSLPIMGFTVVWRLRLDILKGLQVNIRYQLGVTFIILLVIGYLLDTIVLDIRGYHGSGVFIYSIYFYYFGLHEYDLEWLFGVITYVPFVFFGMVMGLAKYQLDPVKAYIIMMAYYAFSFVAIDIVEGLMFQYYHVWYSHYVIMFLLNILLFYYGSVTFLYILGKRVVV